jgi:hypothetical protein
MCPQLEMPFQFLDGIPELGALSRIHVGEEVVIAQILRFKEVHP